MEKRTWKQWKEDVKSMPLFQEDPAAILFVMLWLTIPLWFIPLSVVICWLLGVVPKY
ncbi:hypothetical protein FACS18942_04960 [Planctomycetales bacterium]|nr:hypothetical protein FACS18942_04960 [Planctomycetales bacterium]GHT36467.1 hypothetical protein FACS189427_08130 [Planctomycetales bacterium]